MHILNKHAKNTKSHLAFFIPFYGSRFPGLSFHLQTRERERILEMGERVKEKSIEKPIK